MDEENKIIFKRGDTFSFYANLTTDGTTPLVTSVDNIRCEIRTSSGKLIEEMVVATTATQGEYLFTASDTNNWELGKFYMDIEINLNGVISSSDTIIIEVDKDYTRPKVI